MQTDTDAEGLAEALEDFARYEGGWEVLGPAAAALRALSSKLAAAEERAAQWERSLMHLDVRFVDACARAERAEKAVQEILGEMRFAQAHYKGAVWPKFVRAVNVIVDRAALAGAPHE